MANILLNLIKPLLNSNQRKLLDSGLAQINAYRQTHNIQSRQDILNALQHFGVPKDFLSNTGGLAKNPVVQKIANVCGVDIGRIQEDIRNLVGGSATENNSASDPLQKYRESLSKLK
ncbi:MAG: hypothetical protein II726_02530 [Elusimicrobiaceae bacterium]|nr:hypothetical protein [Elusimicrobiaceae bacterium]